MANEISITTKIAIVNGSLLYKDDPGLKSVTQATAVLYDEVLSITISDASLTCGSISTANYGYARFTNQDGTNYVDIGPTSGGAIVPMVRLLAGESSGWMRMTPSVALRTQAHNGTCKVRVQMLQT